uniref:helix-turn-helix domain-containing protein n=1 Tax=Jeotgalibaca porci TaxID=1868793 RepID=UPI00359F6B12
ERIKRIRVSRKETLEEFGNNISKIAEGNIKTSKSNVSKWEKGLNKPNDIALKAIAELGNTTVNQLLNSNPLSDYSTDELLQELERRGISHETTNQ